ncbi:hypothetical protein HNR06_005208 [Nocardiopsis arvandica]|uniref:Uncharacterized protein n=2 Tax=Nocardiopsis sinuspersici TaxID=501010 RepID=A0A7Y9XH28_9ACTN|nr:hypothetical protein [Nocardiopsis sinuspersici]
MLAMIPRRRWRPGPWSVLLSLLFVAHFFCAAGAVDTVAAAEADGSTAVAGSASAVVGSPVSGGSAEGHHLCQADQSAGADQRTSAAAEAVLLGLGTGTALLRAPLPRTIPWRSSTAVAVPWSGTRLLFSLCVQRI